MYVVQTLISFLIQSQENVFRWALSHSCTAFHDWCSFQMRFQKHWFFSYPGNSNWFDPWPQHITDGAHTEYTSTLVHPPLNLSTHLYNFLIHTVITILNHHSSTNFTSFHTSLTTRMRSQITFVWCILLMKQPRYHYSKGSDNQLHTKEGRFILFTTITILGGDNTMVLFKEP
jgi:hypothetical protein